MTSKTKKKLNLWLTILLAALMVIVLMGIAHITMTGKDKFAGVDFYDYYYAGKLTGNPYDGDRADVLAKGDKVHAIKGSHYIYPPPFLLVSRSFAVMFPRPAAVVWFIVSLYLLMFAVWRLAKYSQVKNKILLTVLWVFFFPTLFTLYVGQVNAILLALVVLTLDDVLKEREYRAGIWIGIGACIKLTPLVLLVPLLFRGKWKVLVTTVAVFVGVSGMIEFISPGVNMKFYGEVLPSLWNMQAHHAHPANQSMRGYLLRVFHNTEWSVAVRNFDQGMVIGMAAMISGFIFLASVCAVKFSSENKLTRTRLYFEASAVLVAVTMISPLGWDHTYIILLIPMTFLLRQKKRWALAVVIIAYLMMILQRAVFIPFADNAADFPFLRAHPGLCFVTLLAAFIVLVPILEQLMKKQKSKTT